MFCRPVSLPTLSRPMGFHSSISRAKYHDQRLYTKVSNESQELNVALHFRVTQNEKEIHPSVTRIVKSHLDYQTETLHFLVEIKLDEKKEAPLNPQVGC